MQKIIGLALTLGLAAVSGAAHAQSDSGAPPSLLGEWVCDDASVVFRDGEWSSVQRTIDVIEQRDALFRAINFWAVPEADGVSGHQDGRYAFDGSHTWLGVIGYDNRTFRITSFDDGHIVDGWILDRDTIGISAIEPGANSWVSRSLCRRAED